MNLQKIVQKNCIFNGGVCVFDPRCMDCTYGKTKVQKELFEVYCYIIMIQENNFATKTDKAS